ncbi:MAG: hypothetical protein K6G83_04135, partial [Lachnospiraceae bacterium]|nr:hypothetical protein [Lachnospiraceae bacterium]
SVGENVAKVSAVSLPSGWTWNELDREKALVWEQTVYANAVYRGADKGNYVTETVSVGITRAPCTHGSTVTKNAKAANCTETGYTGDTYCSLCGKLVKSGETIPTNDSHSYESKVTKEPTKLSDGVMTYTCSRCHKSYTQAVPRLQGGEDYGDLLKDTETGDGKAVVKEETKDGKDENGNKTQETTVTVGGEEVEKTVVNEETGEVKVETKLWVSGIQGSYTYTGSAIKPEPHVYDGTKKLVPDKDYTVVYSGNKNCGTATVTVSFKGNYASTASEELPFTITPAVLGTDVVAADLGVAKTKKAQTPVPAIRFAASGKKLDAGLFSVSYAPATVKDAGTYTATITPKDTQNFTGSMTATITVTADKKVMLSKAKVTISPKTFTYTGKEIVPASTGIKVKLNGKTLTYGKDYEISEVLHNVNPGTATVVLTAVEENEGGYVGSITGTFQIKKGRALSLGNGFSYVYNKSMPYVASGVKPAVTVKDGDTVLEKGKDYTIRYSNNKAAGTGRITLKGTGKYSSSVKLDFTIVKQDINGLTVVAADTGKSKKGNKKPAVTVYDTEGNKLQARDYSVSAPQAPDENGVSSVTVTGLKNYTSTKTVSFRYYKSNVSLGKAKVSGKLPAQQYTGKKVTLPLESFKNILYVNGTALVPGKDFEVASYSGNIKKGTAKVTLRGLGDYAGMKTLRFKITAKQGSYQGVLQGGEWR